MKNQEDALKELEETTDKTELTDEEREALLNQQPQVMGLVMAKEPPISQVQMMYGPPNMNSGFLYPGISPAINPGSQMLYGPPPTDNSMIKPASIGSDARWRDKETWICGCGTENNGKFCSECGHRAPPPPWKCPECGNEDNLGKYCPECGMKRPE